MIAGQASAQTVFDLDTDYATIFPTITGTSNTTSNAGDITANTTSIEKDGITLTVSASTTSTANRIWSSSPRLRMYGGTLTITAKNATITGIEFVNGKWNTGNTTDSGSLAGTTPAKWSGSADAVVLTIAGNTQFKSISVTSVPKSTSGVNAPTIQGTTPFVGSTTITLTADADNTIYYTTDGTDPTNASTLYTTPFTLNASATVKAIAYKGTTPSLVATKEFTAAYNASDIVDFKAQTVGTVQNLTLNNAKVIYADETNKYVYVKDETGAICFYNAGLGLTTGDVLNGSVAGALSIFSNLPEFVANSLTNKDNFTQTPGSPEAPIAATVSELLGDKYLCNLVKISGVKLDSIDSNLYAYQGDAQIQIYDQFKKLTGVEIVKGSNNTVTGILVVYKTTYELYPITTDGIVTAITDLKADSPQTQSPIYNLAGQRVDANYKGVVIQKGKKFIKR